MLLYNTDISNPFIHPSMATTIKLNTQTNKWNKTKLSIMNKHFMCCWTTTCSVIKLTNGHYIVFECSSVIKHAEISFNDSCIWLSGRNRGETNSYDDEGGWRDGSTVPGSHLPCFRFDKLLITEFQYNYLFLFDQRIYIATKWVRLNRLGTCINFSLLWARTSQIDNFVEYM